MNWVLLVCGLVWMHFPIVLNAQKKSVSTSQQLWLGYMTSTRLTDNYSIWNDFHFVPNGFFVARTGLTLHAKNTNFTAGYAFLLLPQSPNNLSLKRKEHRPWAQAIFSVPLPRSFSWVNRLRYDARFKQVVIDSDPSDGYTFTHRVRLLTAFKKMIGPSTDRKWQPYVVLADEVLLNFGESKLNSFDQNRIQFSFGLQEKKVQYQIGYMNRFIKTDASGYINSHTLLFWMTHQLNFKNTHNGHQIKDVTPGD